MVATVTSGVFMSEEAPANEGVSFVVLIGTQTFCGLSDMASVPETADRRVGFPVK